MFDPDQIKERKPVVRGEIQKDIKVAVRTLVSPRARAKNRQMRDTSGLKRALLSKQALHEFGLVHEENLSQSSPNRNGGVIET
jgi:hypothetical protein